MCKVAIIIIESEYAHIFWTPCVLHSLNIAFKTIIVEVQWMKKPYNGCQAYVGKWNHHIEIQSIILRNMDYKGWYLRVKFCNS